MKTNMPAVRVMKNDLDNYVPGVGYAMIPDYCGHFHAWGLELFEQQEGSANYTVGIVEKDDGSIHMVYPTFIQFIRGAEPVKFVPFKSLIMRLGLVEQGDGLDADELEELLEYQQAGLEVEVLCEAADGYYDVKLPNGRIINALSSRHICWFQKDA